MATARLANKAMGSGGTSNVAGGGGESRGGPRGGRGRAGTTSGGGSGGGGGGNRGRNSGGTANHRGSQTGSSSAGNERHDGQTSMMPIGAAVGGAGGRAANLEVCDMPSSRLVMLFSPSGYFANVIGICGEFAC